MPLEQFTIKTTFFPVSGEVCMHIVDASRTVVIYRISHACAKVLNSKSKDKASGSGQAKEQYEKFRGELTSDGFYILIDTITDEGFYVGKADYRKDGKGLLRRMLEKHQRRNAPPVKWDIGFALPSPHKYYFTPEDLLYLERFFYDKVRNSGYKVQNRTIPSGLQGDAKENAEEKLKYYINNALSILTFNDGCKVFENKLKDTNGDSPSEHSETGVQKAGKKRASSPQNKNGSLKKQSNAADRKLVPAEQRLVLALKGPQVDADATGEMIDNRQIIVKAGSRVSKDNKLSNQSGCYGAYKKRIELEESGIIHNRVFTEDYVFPTTSNAAKIILGYSDSGKKRWILKNAKIMGEPGTPRKKTR